MAQAGNKRRSAGSSKQNRNSNRKKSTSRSKAAASQQFSQEVKEDVCLLCGIAVAILLFLCNFHVVGKVGDAVSGFMFGVFGILAYILPILLFFGILFIIANLGSHTALVKEVMSVILLLFLNILISFVAGMPEYVSGAGDLYHYASTHTFSGGLIGMGLASFFVMIIGKIGTIIASVLICIICLVLITEKTIVRDVAGKGKNVFEVAREDYERRKVINEERRQREWEESIEDDYEDSYIASEQDIHNEKRMNKKVKGIPMNATTLKDVKNDSKRDNIVSNVKSEPAETVQRKDAHEEVYDIKINGIEPSKPSVQTNVLNDLPSKRQHKVQIEKNSPSDVVTYGHDDNVDMKLISDALIENADQFIAKEKELQPHFQEAAKKNTQELSFSDSAPVSEKKPETSTINNSGAAMNNRSMAEYKSNNNASTVSGLSNANPGVNATSEMPKRPYKKPPISLLKKNKNAGNADNETQLRETAIQLKQTLKTFGVNVTITDISQGPAVTRYELQPEMGVKVSKIVNLADDIKLNLAATDIRIEAPIPGKAAIGIEVPNKENSAVFLRDLIDTDTFQKFPSKIAFAVGKDIAGKTIVTDIGKMPHVLIAGATGSGKSVCINTLIMSILYKADPDEVKLILVDPKVVELSVYNGIPHLLLPVVTDPKKASAALKWAVDEMTQRYKKFEDMHVRDLKGYNAKVESMTENDGKPLEEKLPQIVIIVDELADLMMVAPGEVEESICRLAQLARAAGIHLVIATQRPSVDVITGLIKANMPSRIAFAVSSGVDSRTILDMVGAEKLLGKGDMLFYPQGYPKPVRVQGAFVTDQEVSDIVEYIISQNSSFTQDTEHIQNQIESLGNMDDSSASSGASERDSYFEKAGRLIIDKDKASIGMLQRVFKIGFNRAARIMDQLCEYGVVGPEEGTKPRKVLMSESQFDQLLEEIL